MSNLFLASIAPSLAFRGYESRQSDNKRPATRIFTSTSPNPHLIHRRVPNREQDYISRYHHMLKPSQES